MAFSVGRYGPAAASRERQASILPSISGATHRRASAQPGAILWSRTSRSKVLIRSPTDTSLAMEGGVVSRLGADLEVRGAVSKYRSIGCLISSSARSCATGAVREVSLSAAYDWRRIHSATPQRKADLPR